MHAPTKASLKAWWQSFTFAQKIKKDSESAALNKGGESLWAVLAIVTV